LVCELVFLSLTLFSLIIIIIIITISFMMGRGSKRKTLDGGNDSDGSSLLVNGTSDETNNEE